MTQGAAPGASQHDHRVPEESVRQELSRVLSSHEFHSSKRSQDFIRYVVEHTLAGRAEMLKERTIGIDVFGRSTSYEPSDDATVRVKAGEVRRRLGLYYAGQGASDPVRIELPAGTYVPEFRWIEVPASSYAQRMTRSRGHCQLSPSRLGKYQKGSAGTRRSSAATLCR